MPSIATNIAANSTLRYLNMNSDNQSDTLTKIASGSRITRASDDAAGLAVSTKLSATSATLDQAATNASHGISILETADGGLSNISDILERMKTLATQSLSGAVTDSERSYIDAEFQALLEEIDSIASSTEFNGDSLLDGTSSWSNTATTNDGVDFLLGTNANTSTGDYLTILLDDVSSDNLGVNGFAITGTTTGGTTGVAITNTAQAVGMGLALADLLYTTASTGVTGVSDGTAAGTTTANVINVYSKLSVENQAIAAKSAELLDTAINAVAAARADVGASMSRFEFRLENIEVSQENVDAANSAIADADIAEEQANLSSYEVLTNAAISALATANSMPSQLMSLFN